VEEIKRAARWDREDAGDAEGQREGRGREGLEGRAEANRQRDEEVDSERWEVGGGS
jgi:hypothetical protein